MPQSLHPASVPIRGLAVLALVTLVLGGTVTPSVAEPALEETERIVHVLNRLGYGPAPGDIERVRALGISAYIDEQLHPERVDDAEMDARLDEFRSFTMSLDELRENYQPVDARGRRARSSAREKREQINAGMADTVGLSATGEPVAPDEFRHVAMTGRPDDYEVFVARWELAVNSKRQLRELMVDFWANHFSMELNDHYYAAHYESQVLRPNALGKFEDLLFATATHPAMLEYLDNWRSAAPAEVLEARIAALRAGDTEDRIALRQRFDYLRTTDGLNENYARELMELHTLGVEGGYTQEDVIQVARCLTGWTITGGRDGEGVFTFDPFLHESGDKVVLGQTIAAGGIDEGEAVLRMLARHPSTATFVSTKLVRRFIADDPPERLVAEAAETFLRTDGDIAAVLETIFASPEFFAPEYHRAKVKKPLEIVVSSLRATRANFNSQQGNGLNRVMQALGEQIYGRETPDGYPDYAAAWLNTNALLVRLRFAFDLASSKFQGIDVDLPAAQALLEEMGVSTPDIEALAENRRMVALAPEYEDVNNPDSENTEMMDSQGMAMGAGEESEDEGPTYTLEQLVVATMLASPEFQKR